MQHVHGILSGNGLISQWFEKQVDANTKQHTGWQDGQEVKVPATQPVNLKDQTGRKREPDSICCPS